MDNLTAKQVYDIGKTQRTLNLIFLFYLISIVLFAPLSLVFSIWAIFQAYYLARALQYKHPGFIAFLMFVPLANFYAFAVISRDSTKALKSKGLRVGVMGASKKELEQFLKSYQANEGMTS
jgi:hypothetical protein